jgi:hypothetical protein
MPIQVTRKLSINGKEYASVDDMPPEVRELYEKAMSALDKDGNGVPDFAEGKGGFFAAAGEILGAAREAQKSGFRVTFSTQKASSPPAEPTVETPSAPALPSAIGPETTGGTLGKLVVGVGVAAAVVYWLKSLGVLP